MKNTCEICGRKLRISGLFDGRGKVDSFNLNSAEGISDLNKFLDDLDIPARYICPDCGKFYCWDCCKDPRNDRHAYCPDCKVRIRLS